MTAIHSFVKLIPYKENMENGVIYISVKYNTSSHLCACGCGEVVVTPLNPHRWTIIYDGETVSFYPSVGNFDLECGSHYFITNNTFVFLDDYSYRKMRRIKKRELRSIEKSYNIF